MMSHASIHLDPILTSLSLHHMLYAMVMRIECRIVVKELDPTFPVVALMTSTLDLCVSMPVSDFVKNYCTASAIVSLTLSMVLWPAADWQQNTTSISLRFTE